MTVRALRRDEIGAAARTLAAAFDEDPLFRYMLPGASRRATWLRWFHLRTVPSRKGQGLGGALLRKACADADAARVPAYLETANPVNLGLYRRFGFEVDGEIRIGDAPTVWTMTRPPG